MRLHPSTVAMAGLAPLALVLALTLSVTTAWAATQGVVLSPVRWALVWSALAVGAVAMAGAAWAWTSEADRAPRRLGLGYCWALALGMVVFLAVPPMLT